MRKFLAILSVVSLSAFLIGNAVQSLPLESQETQLVSQMNDHRRARNLAGLKVDTLICYHTRKAIQRLGGQRNKAYAESAWTEQIGRGIPDWDKWGFLVSGNSVDEILKKLKGRKPFVDALAKPDISHIAVGIFPKSNGGKWCSVWLIHRLVNLGPYGVGMSYKGPTDFTVSGTCSYKDVRVRFYKSEEDPDVYKGKNDESVDVHTDESGKFQATLPISKFGTGDYRIIIYVLDPSENRYRLAAQAHFDVTN